MAQLLVMPLQTTFRSSQLSVARSKGRPSVAAWKTSCRKTSSSLGNVRCSVAGNGTPTPTTAIDKEPEVGVAEGNGTATSTTAIKKEPEVGLAAKIGASTPPAAIEEAPEVGPAEVVFGRSSFPPGFAFGTASSAYQIEGAWIEEGKGESIWDHFTHYHPEKIADRSNGDVATDAFRKYSEDIKGMKEMGVDCYRFSISWSRILPNGTLGGGINKKGVDYYSNLIDQLINNGITPYVTLFHWDLPQALEEKYGGFRSRDIIKDFSAYARLCFHEFGNRVKHWITINEPWSFSAMGYSFGLHAPGRCSISEKCLGGDSIKEPYIVAHNQILAHAEAAKIYKQEFQVMQEGEIGITINTTWFKPISESRQDKEAAKRLLDFMLGWFMDPLVYGDYPFIMRALVRERLPYFTKNEQDMIKGSYDFIGINYYTTNYGKSLPITEGHTLHHIHDDSYAEQLHHKDGVPIGDLHGTWIYMVPDGMKELLQHMKEEYNNPKIYITENGTTETHNPELLPEDAIDDLHRGEYVELHLAEIEKAIRDGAKVKGYFVWSVTDNFEWHEGYTSRFGLNYIDYNNDVKRYPKRSVSWYRRFLEN